MYSYTTRIGYSLSDENKQLKLNELINLFQDTCIFHSEDAGIGLEYLEPRKRAWILCNWQIHINRMPKFGENITVCTEPYEFNGMLGKRGFYLKAGDEVLVYADSLWIYMDMEKKRPAKAPSEEVEKYNPDEKPTYPVEKLGRKIELPEGLTVSRSFTVDETMLDSNHHVNNAKYVELVMPVISKTKRQIKRLRVEYKNSAELGDTVIQKEVLTDNVLSVVLADASDDTYAILEVLFD